MARWPVIVACVAGVALLAPRPLAAQGPGPKQVFTDALARFSLALDGAYGDEGPAAAESLSQMERVRQRWDALIRNYETGMAAEVGGAPADVAARMHLALAGEYLERHRFRDAQRELDAAIALDPKRRRGPDASADSSRPSSPRQPARSARRPPARRGADTEPSGPARISSRASCSRAGTSLTGAAAALEQFVAAQAAAGPAPDGAPFVRARAGRAKCPASRPFFPPAPTAPAISCWRRAATRTP